MSLLESLDNPLLSAITFYGAIFAVGELNRQLIEKNLSKKSSLYKFLMEVVATTVICSCVYENAVLVIHYGLWMFFVVTAIVGFFYDFFGRGAFGTPLPPIEKFAFGEMKGSRFVTIILGQLVGGYLSYRLTRWLWYHSADLSSAHQDLYINSLGQCSINYNSHYFLALAFELVGCFALRTIIPKIPEKTAKYLIPTLFSATFVFAIAYIGDAGLDPLIASTLFFGCYGLPLQWFMLHYWFAPIVGWLLAARQHRSSIAAAEAKQKKDARKTSKKETSAKSNGSAKTNGVKKNGKAKKED